MKVSELKQMIESIVNDEVKNTIINEANEGKKEVFHIMCDGVPLASFDTEAEAQENLPKYKAKNKGELIIEKGDYDSHEDMIDKLDEMNDQLEEKENTNMENTEPMEGNEFSGALKAAKEAGEKSFTVDGKEYDVEECWGKQMEETETEEPKEGKKFTQLLKKSIEETKPEEDCDECGGMATEELVGGQKKLDKNHNGKIDGQDFKMLKDKEEECDECGGATMEVNESKKKTLRLTESELVNLITKMVNESVPGLTASNKAHKESGKENVQALKDSDKKMKDYLSIPGNNNNEFPNQNKEGDKVAVNNTEEEDEFVQDNRGGTMLNLDYDQEPSDKFKDRLKKALEGDTTMGNSQDAANTIKSDLGKNLSKQAERKAKKEDEAPMYNKDAQPMKTVKESKVSFTNVLNEEIEKMKKLTNYNEKTQ